MSKDSIALRKDAIGVMIFLIIGYIFLWIYEGYDLMLTIGLGINVLILFAIIYFSNKDASTCGAFGLIYSIILILGLNIITVLLGIFMLVRSVNCLKS